MYVLIATLIYLHLAITRELLPDTGAGFNSLTHLHHPALLHTMCPGRVGLRTYHKSMPEIVVITVCCHYFSFILHSNYISLDRSNDTLNTCN